MLPSLIWKMPSDLNTIYFTFDDGPDPEVTPYVLEILSYYNIKATFFVIGKNVEKYPEVFNRILSEGHKIGNHSYSHPNGWKTKTDEYVSDIEKASKIVPANLFRPPYGRITPSQVRVLKNKYTIYMWSLLSMDYSEKLNHQDIYHNVVDHVKSGDIIVFHDSKKGWIRLEKSLPKILENLHQRKFEFSVL